MSRAPLSEDSPTIQVTFRIAEEDWQTFGEISEAVGKDRSAIVRRLIRDYTRRTGAVQRSKKKPAGRKSA